MESLELKTLLQRVGVIYNPRKREAKKLILELQKWGKNNSKEIYFLNKEQFIENIDLVFAIGGDGTVLYALQKVAKHNIPVLGINTGRLGFLTTMEAKDFERKIHILEKGEFFIEKHPVIELNINPKNVSYYVFNEVVLLKAENTPLISFELSFGNDSIITPPADGLIVASASGSTAYALSAGGPVIFPELSVVEILPICAHSLSSRPLILSFDREITFSLPRRKWQVEVWIDGKQVDLIGKNENVIVKKAPFSAELLFLKDWNFFKRLKKKLHWR
ncbi:MAG: NAD(+)/NADH kinase [Dictyoglomus sp.]|nr:NAD(+)/NADH kinase [Dictyoglomus sp.]MCX7941787.1 NAD(+)/NADH kinase [Dictyoglomaceae bacterium]MDW8188111.1 NAD(+)/NADH kinase [Dictyoglomus sp.]